MTPTAIKISREECKPAHKNGFVAVLTHPDGREVRVTMEERTRCGGQYSDGWFGHLWSRSNGEGFDSSHAFFQEWDSRLVLEHPNGRREALPLEAAFDPPE